ncbi:alpha/beta hydrolase [Methylocapsa sp. S129]|uniref:alpha/beta hydrolase n=1 Tax=Methylocapsa sp. S129 TaxID=1641869 RepID=UPI00131B4213|nr:alpha/beta hydrolase [Methylocapsa sp. S129]
MIRKLGLLALGVFAAVFVLSGAGLWFASDQLLFPVWRGATRDLADCKPDLAKYWGKDCGNLRSTHEFKFEEVRVPSFNGYELPGWLIRSAENGRGTAKGAILLVPAGGSDRREETKYISFFLGRNLDVLTLDLGCQGEAPCPAPGLTYGQRESRDVLSAYLYLTDKYEKLYAMGSSVGAASILIALPEMPRLTAAIAENPMASFQQLIREAPQSQSLPDWAADLLIKLAMLRGRFDGLSSAENSLPLARSTPIYFIHSKADEIVSYRQAQALVELYTGPKTVWFSDKGGHAAIWDVDHADYENRLAAFLDSVQK